MRIVEPKHINIHTKKSSKSFITRYLIVAVALVVTFTFLIAYKANNKDSNSINVFDDNTSDKIIDTDTPLLLDIEEISTGPREFSGNEFRLLYDNILLENTNKVDVPPYITGDDIADARIRQLAELRGYRLRTTSSTELVSVDGYQLQEPLLNAWEAMKNAASASGLKMSITSGYRSIEEQRELFLNRLQTEGVNVASIAAGTADEQVIKVLKNAALPGYSKHHSGYTVDLYCEGWEFSDFHKSKCNEWLITNNYLNAKLYGFIPSYPDGADLQGPIPEAWEYIYVGVDLLNY